VVVEAARCPSGPASDILSRMRLVLAALGALWVLALSSVVSAQSVEQGRELYLEAEFEGAAAAFDAALGVSSLTSDEALEAERYLTALHLMLGDEGAARRHAEAAVALDPDVSAPEGSPPEAEALLRDVARERGGPAELTIERDSPSEVSARIHPVPTGLVERLRLSCGDVSDEGVPPSLSVHVDPEADVDCEAAALSPGGVALLSATRSLAVGAVTSADDTFYEGEDDEAEGAPIWPWLVAGAGVLVAAAVIIAVIAVASGGGDQAAFGETRVEDW